MAKKIWPDAVATLCGVGKVPKAPGTWGSLASLPFIFALSYSPPFFYMAVTVVCILAAIFSAEAYGQGKDLKEIVVDEFVGLQVAAFLVPHRWEMWLLVFVGFRFFDILKPFPISYFDKNTKGGFGVVLDDLLAGLAVNALIHFVWLKYMI